MITEIQFKQFVIVPKKPKMSPGKIASQVAHATFMALENQRILESGDNSLTYKPQLILPWKKSGMCVIVLECKDTTQLMGIAKYCEQWDVIHHMYIDEGHTEVTMGTPTCLATGVLPLENHWMFSQLELYR